MGAYDWKQKATETKRAIERVSLRKAQNGLTVEVSYEPVKGKKGEVSVYEEPKTHVFQNAKAALDFIKTELG